MQDGPRPPDEEEFMTRLMTKGIAVAMLAALLGVLADDEGDIKYRQALM